MKAAGGPPRRFALEEEGGILRDPATLSSHALPGRDDLGFMRAAVGLRLEARVVDGQLRVQIWVSNVGAGHHLPTGSPARNMLLLVRATDGRERPLPLLSGGSIPRWGGSCTPDNAACAGEPGKGFAKVLTDLVEYPADRARSRTFAAVVPAPYWRPTRVAADSRIPAGGTDLSTYAFDLAGVGKGTILVKARLLYRRIFRSWGRLAGLQGNDLELASREVSLSPHN